MGFVFQMLLAQVVVSPCQPSPHTIRDFWKIVRLSFGARRNQHWQTYSNKYFQANVNKTIRNHFQNPAVHYLMTCQNKSGGQACISCEEQRTSNSPGTPLEEGFAKETCRASSIQGENLSLLERHWRPCQLTIEGRAEYHEELVRQTVTVLLRKCRRDLP